MVVSFCVATSERSRGAMQPFRLAGLKGVEPPFGTRTSEGEADVERLNSLNIPAECSSSEQTSVGRQPGRDCKLRMASLFPPTALPGCTRARCSPTFVAVRSVFAVLAALPVHKQRENDHPRDPGNEHGAHHIHGDPTARHVHTSPRVDCLPPMRASDGTKCMRRKQCMGCTLVSGSLPFEA